MRAPAQITAAIGLLCWAAALPLDPVPLSEVTFPGDEGSDFSTASTLNAEYLHALDADRLLLAFRLNANLHTKGAQPFTSSWEDPSCEVRGQFVGHLLSALATHNNRTGNAALQRKQRYLVASLAEVQAALGGGYLSAFPTEHIARLRALQPVWAPFYVIHKIMAGLLDQWLYQASALALELAVKEAAFFEGYVEDVLATEGAAHWQKMLDNEFGGMAEVLANLYAVTGDPRHSRLALRFVKDVFFQPLLEQRDTLAGLHANTHLAQVNGFAALHEHAGDSPAGAAVGVFWGELARGHSFSSAGTNDHEYWGDPGAVGDQVGQPEHGTETQETCTQYNQLKIARYLLRWSAQPMFADYYERAIFNGIIGTQRLPRSTSARHPSSASSQTAVQRRRLSSEPVSWLPSRAAQQQAAALASQGANWRQLAHVLFDGSSRPLEQPPDKEEGAASQAGDIAVRRAPGALQELGQLGGDGWSNKPGPGVLLYLLSQAAGRTKGDNSHGWGTPLHSFWCCYGSSVESMAKLGDSIYFVRQPQGAGGPPELLVALYEPSALNSSALGLALRQRADLYPRGDGVAKVQLRILDAPGTEVALRLRIPAWAARKGLAVRLNGAEWRECSGSAPGLQAGAGPEPGTFCTVSRKFRRGDVVTLDLPMPARAEHIQDARPAFKGFHSIVMGPHVMAALTPGPRAFRGRPGDVPRLVHEPSRSGLLSLRLGDGGEGALLAHGGWEGAPLRALRGEKARVMAGLGAVFRASHPSRSWQGNTTWGELVAEGWGLEAVSLPGRYLQLDNQGQLRVAPRGNKHSPTGAAPALRQAPEGSEQGTPLLNISVEPAHAALPKGAKELRGSRESYLLVPLGQVVEESYTTYLDFQ